MISPTPGMIPDVRTSRSTNRVAPPRLTDEERPTYTESTQVDTFVQVMGPPSDLAQRLGLLLRETRRHVALMLVRGPGRHILSPASVHRSGYNTVPPIIPCPCLNTHLDTLGPPSAVRHHLIVRVGRFVRLGLACKVFLV